MKRTLLDKILTKEAFERLSRVRIVNPDLAAQTELYLIQLYQAGRLRNAVPDDKLKEVLSYKNLVLPTDYKFADRMILDIGEHTVKNFAMKIKTARTIFWSGPLGMIEREPYHRGTLEVAKAIAKNRTAFSVVGGGETVMFLKKYGLDKAMKFVSTGGGALLDYLADGILLGIEALKRSR